MLKANLNKLKYIKTNYNWCICPIQGKYCVYPRMVYRLAIVMPPLPPNHFRSHFSPFQINTQLLFFLDFVHKMAAILDDRKSLSIAWFDFIECFTTTFLGANSSLNWVPFDRISRHFRSIRNFDFFHKMAAGGHFGWPKITFDRISRHFRSILNFYFFGDCFHKMAAGDHFGWPKTTFDRISRHFRSIRNFFFSQNGCRRLFWMTENHFWSHFSPFQINTQLFFPQNGCQRPFWMTENNFWSHFSPFQIAT